MSNKEELSKLTLNELKDLGILVNKAASIINNDRKGLSQLSYEGLDIALTLELLSLTLTAAEISFQKNQEY